MVFAPQAVAHFDQHRAALRFLYNETRHGQIVSNCENRMGTPKSVFYGVTQGTIYKELLEGQLARSCKDPKKCSRYLAKVLEECIPEVAVEAGNIMKWLRDEEFIRIYSEPVLMNFFKEQWKAHLDVALPAMPPPSNLDIR